MTNVNIKWMKSVWFRHLSWTGFVWFIACKCQWCRSTQQPLCFTLHPEGLWIALHYSDLIDFMISWKYFLWVSHTPRAHRSSVGLFERAHGIFSTVCTIHLHLFRFPAHDNKNRETFSGFATPDLGQYSHGIKISHKRKQSLCQRFSSWTFSPSHKWFLHPWL